MMLSSPGRREGQAVPGIRRAPAETRCPVEAAREAPERKDEGRGTGVRRRIALAAAALAAIVAIALLFYSIGSAKTPQAAPATPRPSPSASPPPTVAQIYAAIAPSVVFIEAARSGANSTETTGTGVVVNGDGMILTALHVINGAQAIKVTFGDGTPSAVTILATDPPNDIAVLAPTTLPSVVVPAVLGRADRLNVGDDVVAIGNPLGLAFSTTPASVPGPNAQSPSRAGPPGPNLLHFDAAVNPASPGGPL